MFLILSTAELHQLKAAFGVCGQIALIPFYFVLLTADTAPSLTALGRSSQPRSPARPPSSQSLILINYTFQCRWRRTSGYDVLMGMLISSLLYFVACCISMLHLLLCIDIDVRCVRY